MPSATTTPTAARVPSGGAWTPQTYATTTTSPHDIGYRKIVKLDHDFLGRDALQQAAAPRTKVTLHWNVDDVMGVIRSQFEPGLPAKYIELPKARHACFQVDKILHKGAYAGMSTDVGYIPNERAVG